MRIDEDKFLTLISILSGLIIFAKLRGDELHIKRGGIKLFNNDSQKMDFRPILAICILLPLDLEHDILTTETCTRDKGIEISFCNFRNVQVTINGLAQTQSQLLFGMFLAKIYFMKLKIVSFSGKILERADSETHMDMETNNIMGSTGTVIAILWYIYGKYVLRN